LPFGPSSRYDITVDQLPPGSWPLQAAFYGLAAAIISAAALLVHRASRATGDGAAAARRRQLVFLAMAMLWVAVVSVAALSGAFNPAQRPPVFFVLMLVSILTIGILLARSDTGGRLARGVPLAVLVGFQAFRFPLELAMHRAYSEGLMPVQMSYSGRNFDIVTGITALALAVSRVPHWVVRLWNVMGLVLLANIVGVAMLSTPVFALFGPDRLNVFVMRMPYVLLPAVMVLAAWAGHLIVFRALRR
jgi:hypothetical protein